MKSTVAFKAPPELVARIKSAAIINDLSMSELCRRVMWLAVATKPPGARQEAPEEIVDAEVEREPGGPHDPPEPPVLKACPRCGPPRETHCKKCGAKLRPGGY